jgi:hypothetical protein
VSQRGGREREHERLQAGDTADAWEQVVQVLLRILSVGPYLCVRVPVRRLGRQASVAFPSGTHRGRLQYPLVSGFDFESNNGHVFRVGVIQFHVL